MIANYDYFILLLNQLQIDVQSDIALKVIDEYRCKYLEFTDDDVFVKFILQLLLKLNVHLLDNVNRKILEQWFKQINPRLVVEFTSFYFDLIYESLIDKVMIDLGVSLEGKKYCYFKEVILVYLKELDKNSDKKNPKLFYCYSIISRRIGMHANAIDNVIRRLINEIIKSDLNSEAKSFIFDGVNKLTPRIFIDRFVQYIQQYLEKNDFFENLIIDYDQNINNREKRIIQVFEYLGLDSTLSGYNQLKFILLYALDNDLVNINNIFKLVSENFNLTSQVFYENIKTLIRNGYNKGLPSNVKTFIFMDNPEMTVIDVVSRFICFIHEIERQDIQSLDDFQLFNEDFSNLDYPVARENFVSVVLDDLNISRKFCGYSQLKSAVMYVLEKMDAGIYEPINFSEDVFKTVSSNFGVTWSSVERNIQTLVKKIVNDKNSSIVKKLNLDKLEKVSVSDFVELIAFYIRKKEYSTKTNFISTDSIYRRIFILDNFMYELGITSKYSGRLYIKLIVLKTMMGRDCMSEYRADTLFPGVYKQIANELEKYSDNVKSSVLKVIKLIFNSNNKAEIKEKVCADCNEKDVFKFISNVVSYIDDTEQPVDYSFNVIKLSDINNRFVGPSIQSFEMDSINLCREFFIENIFSSLGISFTPVLRDVVNYVLNSCSELSFSKELYPFLASKYNTSVSNIRQHVESLVIQSSSLVWDTKIVTKLFEDIYMSSDTDITVIIRKMIEYINNLEQSYFKHIKRVRTPKCDK